MAESYWYAVYAIVGESNGARWNVCWHKDRAIADKHCALANKEAAVMEAIDGQVREYRVEELAGGNAWTAPHRYDTQSGRYVAESGKD